jgi:dipeptidyl aminopeptidase B
LSYSNPVRGKLGQYEAEDQIEVARQWAAEKKYISRARVGIWGWSFGGYLAAKVLEADSGIVSLAISVAPVTDWRVSGPQRYERTRADLALFCSTVL